MSKLSFIADFVISRAVIFTVAFIWARHYVKDAWAAAGISLAVTVSAGFVLSLVGRKRRGKKALTAAQNKEKTDFMTRLIFSDGKETAALFRAALKGDYSVEQTADNFLIAEGGGKKAAVFTRFRRAVLDTDDIAAVYASGRAAGADKITLFTRACSAEAKETAARLSPAVTVKEAGETYKFLKDRGATPPAVVSPNAARPKKALRQLASLALSRRRFKGYLLGAAIMIAGSLFVPYTLYYLISASVFLTLALATRFNKNAETEK